VDAASSRHCLGTLGAVDCCALALTAPLPGLKPVPLRTAMLGMVPALGALAGRAAQIIEWGRSHRHCGVCGTATELQPGERARTCPACRHTACPRLRG